MRERHAFNRRRLLIAAPLTIFAARAGIARAQPFPAKPIRLLIGHPPGGQADVIARIVSPRLGEALGQPVVSENRPGAAGMVAAGIVAKSQPDGYTLHICSSASLSLARVMNNDLAFDPTRDFTMLSRVAIVPTVLAVGSWIPVTSVAELVDYAKARPGVLAAGSSGNGSTSGFSLEMLKAAAGIDILQVPYAGLAPAMAGLLSRQVDLVFSDYALVAPHAKTGAVRLLGTPASRRFAAMPELATLREQGQSAVMIDSAVGFVAPAALPPDVFAQLTGAFTETIGTRVVRDRLQQAGFEPLDDTPAKFEAAVADDIRRYSAVAARLGIGVAGGATAARR